MKVSLILISFILGIANCSAQTSEATLILFNGNISFTNSITVIKIDTINRKVFYKQLIYNPTIRELRKKNEKYVFDSLISLKKLIDSARFDTFKYSKGKIILKDKQYAFFKKNKLRKVKKETYSYLSREHYEEIFYCEYKNVDIYFFMIPFDLYDFRKNKFRKLENGKKGKWRIVKNLSSYDGFGHRYRFINSVLPFFSPYSFVGERENRFGNYFEIGNFYESYKYMEKLLNSKK